MQTVYICLVLFSLTIFRLMKKLLLILLVPTFSYAQKADVEIFDDYIDQNGVQIIQSFKELLSMPNVAVDLPNINKNAEYIKEELDKRGVQTKLLRMVGTPPIVFGYLPVKNAKRTLAFYVHYDGQPADPSNWKHQPWDPQYYDRDMFDGGSSIPFPTNINQIDPENRIYARSAGDDKAPIISILTALDAIKENNLQITSNIVFFFEGQEEAGSKQLRTYLEDNKELIDEIDIWMFCDGPVHQSRTPQLVFGVRGVTGMEITVYGPNRSLHSGHYGNWAPVPGQMLSEMIATFKDGDGNVIIDGYYDDVVPLTGAEMEALASVPPIDEQLKRELGLANTEGDQSLYERLLYPSLTIKGITTGNTGALARNVIPSKAVLSLGMRLVQGCDPEVMKDRVEKHIEGLGYYIVRQEPTEEERLQYPKIAKIERGGGYPAAKTSMSDPFAKEIIKRTKEVVGEDLILMPSLGGSLPLFLFTDILEKPAIIVPIANHDNNQHAPNENIRIENLWYGIRLMGGLLTM